MGSVSALSKYMITVLLLSGVVPPLPSAGAMDRRPPTRSRTDGNVRAPEIEIITMSDQARREFLEAPQTHHTVAPGELLPPVSPSRITAEQKSRVQDIQTALKNAGFDPGSIDGKSGPRTKKAIRAFQRAHNLVVDGIVGEKTWSRLKHFLTAEAASN